RVVRFGSRPHRRRSRVARGARRHPRRDRTGERRGALVTARLVWASASPILRRLVITAKRVVTCDPARATAANPLGVIEDGAVVFGKEFIVDVGPRTEMLVKHRAAPIEAHPEAVVTPGLVDAHTHAPWIGSRDDEYVMRMAGADYEAIAAAGGGI